jgi:hypothetical protein
MRGRLPLVVLLGSALVFLVSLYLPWRSGPHGILPSVDGWGADAGYAAALTAVAIVWAAVAGVLRPTFAAKLPLGGLGIALAYFAYGALSQIHSSVEAQALGASGHGSWAYGSYLGVAAATLAGLAALVLRREQLVRRRPAGELAAAVLGLGLVASFLLPWETFAGFGDLARVGLDTPPAPIAAAWLLVGAGRWLGDAGVARLRLVVALIAAVLTGAAASGADLPGSTHDYGRWVGIGCAIALVVLEAAGSRHPFRSFRVPSDWSALRTGGAVLLLVALFLPWVEYGVPHHSLTTNGWEATFGATAGALALGLLAAPVLTWIAAYALEIVLGSALLVATLGVIASADYPAVHMGYGSYVGFAAAALLVVGTLAPLRWPPVDRRRVLARAVPLLASLACVAALVLPVWQGVLPRAWMRHAEPVIGWFWVVALLLALHLLCLWAGQIGQPSTSRGLVLTPLFILPLPALQLINERNAGVIWGGVILIGLCLLLAVLGRFERTGELEKIGIPELLRVDRLPGTET